ncbi:MAG: archaemetzincin family Zn-dependent metalloprotease [Thaumarchaeota archaeon]|nr:archaemetzincin family Zn-dependent metalloprotease [Nitrososphaerota archaeon]
MKSQILLQALGPVTNNILKMLETALPKRFISSSFALASSLELPFNAFDSSRKQYVSPEIISFIHESCNDARYQKILGICDVNAYSGRLNFVFGEAQFRGRIAAIYLARLREEMDDPFDERIFLQRVVTEAVHEIGHLFGLQHCSSSSCVMYFSNSLGDTDKKGSDFCSACKTKIIRA